MIMSNKTLFVVDDQEDARRGVAALASSLDLRCETFASAEEFLQRHDRSLAGCLLIDLRLDGIDGLELQRRLTAMGCTLPVVFVSAYADVPSAVTAMKNGALTFLEKPYRENQLAEAIQTALAVDANNREANLRRAETRRRVDALNPRERCVMESMLVGKANKSVARSLGISHRTVDRLRASVYEKMGVESPAEVARLVTELRASSGEVVSPCSDS